MAVTNQQIIDYLNANPNITGQQLQSVMAQYGVSPSQIASALTENVNQYGTQTQTMGNAETGQMNVDMRNLGAGFNAYQDANGNVSGFSRVDPARPGMIQLYGPNGEYRGEEKITTTTQDLLKNIGPIALAAGGTALAQGALGSSLFGTTEGLPLSELLPGANNLATATNVSDVVGGTEGGLLSGGSNVAGMGGGTGLTTSGVGGLGVAGTGAGLTAGALGAESLFGGSTLGSTLGGLSTGVGAGLGGTLAGVGTGVGANLAKDIGTGLLSKTVADNIGNAAANLTGLAGGVIQSKASKEAAQNAAQNINAATQAGVTASQFRPVGMTTRFGTSNFTYDPTTGQMVSAGYQLSPEAKAAQDRLVALAGSGLTQAEQAQKQFAPLQTAAQNLFSLGSQYIAKSPEQVAQDYINKQMALLAPTRQTAMANLMNTLSNTGTTGLSIAQGGDLKAANPVAQAFANAQAMQDLQLAANAQKEGQASTLFGSNLYDLGTAKLSNFYGGQTAAYQPYTTALGQIQSLETAGQQPLMMGASLGQQSASAGANAGRLGVTGAIGAGNLLTSPAVTTNPYAAFLSGAASPTSTFGQGISNWLTGYNPTADQNAVVNPYFTPTTSVWGS